MENCRIEVSCSCSTVGVCALLSSGFAFRKAYYPSEEGNFLEETPTLDSGDFVANMFFQRIPIVGELISKKTTYRHCGNSLDLVVASVTHHEELGVLLVCEFDSEEDHPQDLLHPLYRKDFFIDAFNESKRILGYT